MKRGPIRRPTKLVVAKSFFFWFFVSHERPFSEAYISQILGYFWRTCEKWCVIVILQFSRFNRNIQKMAFFYILVIFIGNVKCSTQTDTWKHYLSMTKCLYVIHWWLTERISFTQYSVLRVRWKEDQHPHHLLSLSHARTNSSVGALFVSHFNFTLFSFTYLCCLANKYLRE